MSNHLTPSHEPRERGVPAHSGHAWGGRVRHVIVGAMTSTALLLGGTVLSGGIASAEQPANDEQPATDQMTDQVADQVTDNGAETPIWTSPTYPGVPAAGVCEQQKIEKWTSVYNDGVWSPWVDYPDAGPLWDDGRDRTGHHTGTHEENGDRHFAYVVVDTRPITTGDCAPAPADPSKLSLTFIQECGVFTAPDGPWTAPATTQFRLRNENAAAVDYVLRQAGAGTVEQGELPVGDTFVTFPFGARTLILETYDETGTEVHSDTQAGGDTFLTTGDDGVKCLPTTPGPRVETGEWIDGEYDCDDTIVDQTRVVTTTSSVWNGEKFVETTTTATETRTRDLGDDEIEECATPTPAIPLGPAVTPPTCEAAGTSTIPGLSTSEKELGVTYVVHASEAEGDEIGAIVVRAFADDGYVIETGVRTTWTIRPSDLAKLTGDDCAVVSAFPPTPPFPPMPSTQTPPTQTPPTQTPPAQTPPVVAALPPVLPQGTQRPPTAVQSPPEGLPATGGSTQGTLLLALAALGAGSALLGLRRRPA